MFVIPTFNEVCFCIHLQAMNSDPVLYARTSLQVNIEPSDF